MTRKTAIPGIVLAIALVFAAVPPVAAATSAPVRAASSAPGVTSTEITTGAISTLTGPLAADFNGVVPGIKAYFDMINAQGGVNGRKLNLAYSLDDGGNPSQFTTLARDLVDQDHVFALTGVTTDFFSPGFLTQTGTPTFGFNSTGGWSGAPNLYGSDGSVQCYTCIVPHIAYLAKQSKAKSVALLAYGVKASSALCSAAEQLLPEAGLKVSYVDLAAPIDGNLAPDVQKIQHAGSDFVVSCVDLDGNISLARALQQYGVKATQLWFSGYDQSAIDKYTSLMQHVYFFVPTVPLTTPTKDYPGLALYLKTMKKYEPQFETSALAPEGWISAALFVAGVKAAGSDLTQQRVVQLTNQITNFDGGGLTALGNWKTGHSTSTNVPTNYPVCAATAQVQGKVLAPIYVKGKGSQVLLCLGAGAVKNPVPLVPPVGTPGT